MTPIIGQQYRVRISGRVTRVQIHSQLMVARHLCGKLWTEPRIWWLAKTVDTNRTVTIKRASRLKPLRERVGV